MSNEFEIFFYMEKLTFPDLTDQEVLLKLQEELIWKIKLQQENLKYYIANSLDIGQKNAIQCIESWSKVLQEVKEKLNEKAK